MKRALGLTSLVCLGACVGFHPREPQWERPATPLEATSPSPRLPPPSSPDLTWREIGQSVQGRPLRLTSIGNGPRQVLWIGGIHGDEREGRIATAELPAAFFATPGAAAAVTLHILEDLNPDGSRAETRYNANAVDLNRNYPAQNFKAFRAHGGQPLSQPEAKALHDLILQTRPALVIVAHSTRGNCFINFDGPGEALARNFSAASQYPVKASSEFYGTPGSLGSWVGIDLGIPILTLEYARGREPHAAWAETRAAILGAITSR